MAYGVYDAVSGMGDKAPSLVTPQEEILPEEGDQSALVTQGTQSNPGGETTESHQSTTETAASGTVKGKILERFISPYNAGLSYGKVYVKNSTDLDIDIASFLKSAIGFTIQKNTSPQVLIVHTHTTETYMTSESDTYTNAFSSRSRDASRNMVSVGDIVAQKLNHAGIVTLHDSTEHDYPQYTGSYTRAANTINGYLQQYDSIKVVLDLHRDAITSGESDKVKLTTEINGKKAAQVMIVMGSQSGTVTKFPKWKENLKLALRLQQVLETDYPTLARPLSLMSKYYNENLTTGSMLIEVGTDANTLQEAHYSAELLGNALVTLLQTLK